MILLLLIYLSVLATAAVIAVMLFLAGLQANHRSYNDILAAREEQASDLAKHLSEPLGRAIVEELRRQNRPQAY